MEPAKEVVRLVDGLIPLPRVLEYLVKPVGELGFLGGLGLKGLGFDGFFGVWGLGSDGFSGYSV